MHSLLFIDARGRNIDMSLINCPECGHEVSTAAAECPNCGRPLQVLAEPGNVVTAVPVRRDSFPGWVFIPLGILGVLLVLAVFLVISNRQDQEDANANVNVSVKRAAAADPRASRVESQTVTAPQGQPVSVPSSSGAMPSSGSTTTVPTTSAPVPADRGVVLIDARVMGPTGLPLAVRNEKFYLLDEEPDRILSEAGLDSINGQSLTDSLGLSVMYPDRYGDFRHDAFAAINSHIKYSVQTDATGKALIKDIKPDVYYLFGVTKSGKGFAVWSSSVVVNAGQNALNLSPQPITEIAD
jgi:uncharacterized OB-fold protein